MQSDNEIHYDCKFQLFNMEYPHAVLGIINYQCNAHEVGFYISLQSIH